MPIYEYYCTNCEHAFTEVLPMARYDEPCEQECPSCLMEGIKRGVPSSIQTGVDATLTPDKATGGRWGELMDRMKNAPGIRKQDADHLSVASSRTGKKMGPQ